MITGLAEIWAGQKKLTAYAYDASWGGFVGIKLFREREMQIKYIAGRNEGEKIDLSYTTVKVYRIFTPLRMKRAVSIIRAMSDRNIFRI